MFGVLWWIAIVQQLLREAGTAMTEIRARYLRSFCQKLRGLLGTHLGDAQCGPVLLEHCYSVHTFGMHYAIDIAFINEGGKVIRVEHGVEPGCQRGMVGSVYVLERPASSEIWPELGQQLELVKTQRSERGLMVYVRF